ncbi:MAG: hypothetical protein UV07_C0005G0028 [Candidatus Azambacteria bacterium GW2011_GWB1_42_17]|uniref:Uncharacterized protein n=1 Tax=Candidatus Azambacteria bacterium GW2011_GWB1_42_17 TaxID=1618615 RepID=A0A0G0Z7G9_9BACT|nr:MAG: hypothetical protein UV07_C0005G0028 [Candidatus Azambacteria bacterium GW2011_GWB1_42_17]
MKIKENRSLFLLILLLLVTLTMLTTARQILKTEKYAESVEEAVDIVSKQSDSRFVELVEVQNLHFQQIIDLQKKVDTLQSGLKKEKKERDQTNRLLGIDGKYDKNNVLIKQKDLDTFLNYKTDAVSLVVFNVKSEKYENNIVGPPVTAPAIIIGKYVLISSHTNDPEVLKEMFLSNFPESVKVEIFKHNVVMVINDKPVELKEIYRNREKDFSLFEIPAEAVEKVKTVSNFPFEMGRSGELKIGNFIFMNGRPGGEYEIARSGHVTTLSILYRDENNNGEYKKDDNSFGISEIVLPGDSGSPIVAFRDGKPELVGITLGYIDGRGKGIVRSYALKIDVATDEIKSRFQFGDGFFNSFI